MHWMGTSFPYSETNIHHLQIQIFQMLPERFNSFINFFRHMSDRDKALGSVLWEDLPLVLLTHSEWEAVKAPSTNSKEGTLHQWGNKKPKGRLPKPQHCFILEQLARTGPGASEARGWKTKTLLSTGERPRPSTKSPPVNLLKSKRR